MTKVDTAYDRVPNSTANAVGTAPGSNPTREEEPDALLVDKPDVVFRSQASYHWAIWVLLGFAPAATFLEIYLVFQDDDTNAQEKQKAINSLLWTTVSVMIVYLFVLPKRYEVVDDASINVVTFMYTHKFPHVTAAFGDQGLLDGTLRPRWKFGVDFSSSRRVLVRRKRGCWDVLVTPKQPLGFVDAVWAVAHRVENAPKKSEPAV